MGKNTLGINRQLSRPVRSNCSGSNISVLDLVNNAKQFDLDSINKGNVNTDGFHKALSILMKKNNCSYQYVSTTSVGATSSTPCCYTVSKYTSSCPNSPTYYNPCTQTPSPSQALCVTWNATC